MSNTDRPGVIGTLAQFNENDNWDEYCEICEHFFEANGITDDKQKVSILCSNVGGATYHLIKNLSLPKKPNEQTFAELSKLVKNHFKPKISEASASLQFNTRIRKHNETVQMYVAELRRMAALCNFGEFLDRALRDRFIAGINNESIQQKILSVTDDQLTFATAFKIAQVHESACRNVKELQQYGESQKVMKITQRGKAPEREKERLKRYEGRDRSQRDEERDRK